MQRFIAEFKLPVHCPVLFSGTIPSQIIDNNSDIARERVPLDAANFQKENLKSVTTTEPANRDINLMVRSFFTFVIFEAQQKIRIFDPVFQKVQNFDQTKLKKVETNEKSILNQEKSILEAANYDQSKLNKVEAVEKNVLPTDDGKLRTLS